MTIKAFVFDAYGTLYDTHSVAAATEAAFPGHGDYITQVWRQKQLEYSWLRTAMGRWQDFRAVTRDSFEYTLATLGLTADPATVDRLVSAYDRLTPYPEAAEALRSLGPYRRAILSNGSQPMLDSLVRNSPLNGLLDMVISVDPKRVFKPHPHAYELIEERLGVAPEEVVFVSSNGFDIAGATSFGLRVARIERVPGDALRTELTGGPIGPAAMFKALRTQPERLGCAPAAVIRALTALPDLLGRGVFGRGVF
ncbi:MAG TPA: haloacid dehalogenase type II [Rhodopila sp.]|uniref:haloacid dehalogenase type II n=1 Tax=Rhodopila sp. TaxID=2480087 RepID=UPI002D058661|nr:haloacid dehalogenase type II [Rhodopila sp.]HVY17128.1 haloacid dehalogenase type II [Rhodopila sp.]